MSKVRVVFLGTPEFAVTCLKGLVEDEHFEVVGVVTQPDRPAGRKMQLQPSPVKSFAQARSLPVISPESVNTETILQTIDIWGAEVAVVVAFGQLLSEKFLQLFPLGAVNIHGSLLPRWRGAAPIQRALQAGDTETGVSLQKIVKKLDAGDVLGFRRLPITDETDAGILFQQMATAGVDLLQIDLMDYVRGNLVGEVQDESKVTYAKKIDKTEGEIDWTQPAVVISQKIRAFVMGPGTWSFHESKKIKIHRAVRLAGEPSHALKAPPGTVLKAEGTDLWVQTGDGVLALLELQAESRNRMVTADFLKGSTLKKGDLLQQGSNHNG